MKCAGLYYSSQRQCPKNCRLCSPDCEQCLDGFRLDQTKQCVPCQAGCKTCSPDSCQECLPDRILVQAGLECVPCSTLIPECHKCIRIRG